MTNKIYSVKIIGLSLHPVGREKQTRCRINVQIIDIGKYFEANANVVFKIVQVINHGDLSAFLIGIVNAAKRCKKSEF